MGSVSQLWMLHPCLFMSNTGEAQEQKSKLDTPPNVTSSAGCFNASLRKLTAEMICWSTQMRISWDARKELESKGMPEENSLPVPSVT